MITRKLRSLFTGHKTSIHTLSALRPGAVCGKLALRSAIILLFLTALVPTSAREALANATAV